MAIFDCFQYFDEDHILDIRFNILDQYVDYFVISESTKTHQGKNKKLNFNIDNFTKYKNKIIYVIAENKDHNEIILNHKGGESIIEQNQRNALTKGLQKANSEDLIILSDSDEIPDLSKLNQIQKNKKFICFSQKTFMYKLNLQNISESDWKGSRITKMKYLSTPQGLRNIKFKNYPFWRFDKKNLQIIEGGWHFSYLHSPEKIKNKILSFSHGEFNKPNFTNLSNIQNRIEAGRDIFERGHELKKVQIDSSFPAYIIENQKKLSQWII